MFEFLIDSQEYTNIHFIGIGGISMSGLAEILLKQDLNVSGSDSKNSKVVNRLRDLGAHIYIGQKASNINKDTDLVIYTDAISSDNEELLEAKKLGIEIIDRASFLGALMKNYDDSIAISGTHGKTTTTSMLSTILNNSDLNPTILLGGQLSDIGGNVRLGSRKCLLTEACEYKGNILKYFPTIAVIMNIDEDHLDYFKSIDHIVDTFSQFASNLKEDNFLIINSDDENKDTIIESTKAQVRSFGIDNPADYQAKNIKFSSESTSFHLYYDSKFVREVRFGSLGKHNTYNALASIAAAHTYGLDMDFIISNLEKYSGVERRLEFKGYYNGAKVIDDYAHHPTEIRVTLNALKKSIDRDNKIFCIFQPHTYTRTQKLFESFSASFKDADITIVTDIFAARELDDGSVHSKDLVSSMTGTEAIYISGFDDIKDYIVRNAGPGDIILTMGAGNIYELGELILEDNVEVI